jgi:hypothetical protein
MSHFQIAALLRFELCSFVSPGALAPYGDLHNYAPPPAPFTPDLLEGLSSTHREVSTDSSMVISKNETALGDDGGGSGYLDESRGIYCIVAQQNYMPGDQVWNFSAVPFVITLLGSFPERDLRSFIN